MSEYADIVEDCYDAAKATFNVVKDVKEVSHAIKKCKEAYYQNDDEKGTGDNELTPNDLYQRSQKFISNNKQYLMKLIQLMEKVEDKEIQKGSFLVRAVLYPEEMAEPVFKTLDTNHNVCFLNYIDELYADSHI